MKANKERIKDREQRVIHLEITKLLNSSRLQLCKEPCALERTKEAAVSIREGRELGRRSQERFAFSA